jgi:hypothetical protein
MFTHHIPKDWSSTNRNYKEIGESIDYDIIWKNTKISLVIHPRKLTIVHHEFGWSGMKITFYIHKPIDRLNNKLIFILTFLLGG